MSTLELRNTKLQQELAEQAQLLDRSRDTRPKSRDQSRDYEERVERLQVELEKKTSMLLEVRRHLREAVEREKLLKSLSTDPQLSENYLTLLREKEQLQKQVAQVRIHVYLSENPRQELSQNWGAWEWMDKSWWGASL